MKQEAANSNGTAAEFIAAFEQYFALRNAEESSFSPARRDQARKLKNELSALFERAVEEKINERFSDDLK